MLGRDRCRFGNNYIFVYTGNLTQIETNPDGEQPIIAPLFEMDKLDFPAYNSRIKAVPLSAEKPGCIILKSPNCEESVRHSILHSKGLRGEVQTETVSKVE